MSTFVKYLPEFFFALCGLVSIDCAVRALKNENKPYGTALFWALLGIIFIFGKIIPYQFTGLMLIIMGSLTATHQVQMGKFQESTPEARKKSNEKIGSLIFLPAVLIGVMALLMSFVKINGKNLDGASMVGIACLVAMLVAVILCKPKVKETRENTSRLLMQVGSACLLPQLLGALGTLFTKAGVGEVIAGLIGNVVPSGNIVLGVIIYCLGMVIFTMIMGNGFAAFSVITVGIGVPFVIMQGGNPTIVGALGLTCGFCGTLMTPMAANFNVVPCAVLEMKDRWSVIKAQLPMALIMIVVHVALMLTLAF